MNPRQPWDGTHGPGVWFWALLATGAFARAFLVFATQGTLDVPLWIEHAAGVSAHGIVGHYREDPFFNHPPLIGFLVAQLWNISQETGIAFRILHRGLVAAFDLANVGLLSWLLVGNPARWLIAGLYAVMPVGVILGAFHGNNDAMIATLALAATIAAARGRPLLAGAVLGAGLWIKLPIVLAAPAIGFALPRWRDRFACALVALTIGVSTYLPALTEAPALVWANVFEYQGLVVRTPGGFWIWGLKTLFFRGFGPTMTAWPAWASALVVHGTGIALGAIVLFAFLRRRERTALGIAKTIAGSYAIFYALIDAWSFQYFAWSAPFWLLAGLPFALASNLFAGGYIWGLYAYLCGDVLLRPAWDFEGLLIWPAWILLLRDLALLTFVTFSFAWMLRAASSEVRWWGRRGSAPTESR